MVELPATILIASSMGSPDNVPVGVGASQYIESVPVWGWAVGPATVFALLLSEVFALRRRFLWDAVSGQKDGHVFVIKAAWILMFPGLFTVIGFARVFGHFSLNPLRAVGSGNPLHLWPTWVILLVVFVVLVAYTFKAQSTLSPEELTKLVADTNATFEAKKNDYSDATLQPDGATPFADPWGQGSG